MLYVKGGAAWMREEFSDSSAIEGFSGHGHATRSGWTAGGGVEYKLGAHWAALVEYDYVGLGNKRYNISYTGNCADWCSAWTYGHSSHLQTALFGVNYRF